MDALNFTPTRDSLAVTAQYIVSRNSKKVLANGFMSSLNFTQRMVLKMIESAAKYVNGFTKLGDHHCDADHLGHTTGTLPFLHKIAALDHHWSVVTVSYVRLPETRGRLFARIPPDKEIWRRALQKSTSHRVPQIHLHRSTNPTCWRNFASQNMQQTWNPRHLHVASRHTHKIIGSCTL